ncbi:hypothetical protein PHYSODRAFT_335179 [Phytophthora sojae]|uniref:Protein kinase domain-containing protein n=1 Tax=Phytophthora sojae (strain P6497) TaxID=1094619 RepID=G4ZUC8_PHYSP|nr:hypothetical protein PHYSODRAFT_335179 [Phytophthora sojae]EGZ13402.1 hypothetical protein PHYSODRAFT_335179 [Phytophthora sojae]|eukprot:XP_009530831.1 hypothetical protein PHYSODRAFT_335179 [Phytophthora sojae]
MSELHRFWSLYADSSCGGVPTGVFMRALSDCASQVAANGATCTAKTDAGDNVIGYVNESCHEGRIAGLDALYGNKSYIAYDYYTDDDCSRYENSVAYQASTSCETVVDSYGHVRSARMAVSGERLVLTQNVGPVDKALNCPGSTGPDYNQLNVLVAEINHNVCESNLKSIDGGFIFYNTTATATALSSSGSSTDIGDWSSSGTNDSSFPGDGLAVGPIAGTAGGATVLVIALACCCWRRGRKDSTTSLQDPLIGKGNSSTAAFPTDSDLGLLWNDDAIVAHRVPRDQVRVDGLISRGGFGEVFRGSYNQHAVAVKMLLADTRSDLKKVNLLLEEAKLMVSLSHPHIVRFVGVSWGSLADLCVLSELMEGGDLQSLLKDLDARGHAQGFDYDKVLIAYHTAQALMYLHSLSPIVIHRDLKSKNVLLSKDLEAKLADFGASRERQEHTMTAGVGTLLWMAPEVMLAERYTEKADIFSFGVLLSELDTQKLPYASETGKKMPDAVLMQKVALGTLQVAFSPCCLSSLAQLGRECVELDPSARPSAPTVGFRLHTVMRTEFASVHDQPGRR